MESVNGHKDMPLFSTGDVVVTTAALEVLTSAGIAPRKLVERHVRGDFGDQSPSAARDNLQAAQTGYRVLSRYRVGVNGDEIFVMTNKTRKNTYVLDPREYGVGT